MDAGDLRTDVLLPVVTPTSPSADERRPPRQPDAGKRRRSRFEDEPGEPASPSENNPSSEHAIDRLARPR